MNQGNAFRKARIRLQQWDVGVVGILMLVTVAAGLLQNPLDTVLTTAGGSSHEAGARWSLWSGPLARYPDDVAALALVIASLFRARKVRLFPAIFVGVWMFAMVLGAAHSLIFALEPLKNIVDLFRQTALPAALIFAGMTLRIGERRLLVWATFIVAALNSIYAAFEVFGLRLFDPVILANQVGRGINDRTGLPGNFMGWSFDGSRIERIGGLFISPPLAGVFMGFATAISFWCVRNLLIRYAASVVFALVTVGTLGRSGLVMLVAGIAVPLIIRWLGRIPAVVIAVTLGVLGFLYISSHGNSLSHVRGIIKGTEDGLFNPLGRGFGFIGNLAKDWRAHESLAGIGLSAGGWLAILALLALIVALVIELWRSRGRSWESAVALGTILCAMLSESAGALAGSVPMWLFIGVAAITMPPITRRADTQALRRSPSLSIL